MTLTLEVHTIDTPQTAGSKLLAASAGWTTSTSSHSDTLTHARRQEMLVFTSAHNVTRNHIHTHTNKHKLILHRHTHTHTPTHIHAHIHTHHLWHPCRAALFRLTATIVQISSIFHRIVASYMQVSLHYIPLVRHLHSHLLLIAHGSLLIGGGSGILATIANQLPHFRPRIVLELRWSPVMSITGHIISERKDSNSLRYYSPGCKARSGRFIVTLGVEQVQPLSPVSSGIRIGYTLTGPSVGDTTHFCLV